MSEQANICWELRNRSPSTSWLVHWNIKSRLSLIVRVNVALSRTVLVNSDWSFDNLCGSHLQSQSELYHVSWWYYTLVIDLIGQLRHDAIGRLSVEPWCYWLWRLVISNWRDTTHFDSEDDYHTGCRSISHCQQQQSYSGLCSPGRSNSTYFWNYPWAQTFHTLKYPPNSLLHGFTYISNACTGITNVHLQKLFGIFF